MRKLGVAFLVTLAAGCGDQSRKTEDPGIAKILAEISAYQPAANTPDLAVKSWWHLKDKQRELFVTICPQAVKRYDGLKEKYDLLKTSDVYMNMACAPERVYERTIDSVNIQSDSMALVSVTVKNVEPPEPGATLDASERTRKESGTKYRYTLTRASASADWKIESVQSFQSWNNSWSSVYKKRAPSTNSYVFDSDQ